MGELTESGALEESSEEADAKQLVEMLAPRDSHALFILLMWTLDSGDYIKA